MHDNDEQDVKIYITKGSADGGQSLPQQSEQRP